MDRFTLSNVHQAAAAAAAHHTGSRRSFCGVLAGGLLAGALPARALAGRQTTLVYGYAQGSAADGVLNLMLKILQPQLAIAPTVRYLPGKGAALAAAAVRRGPPDGSLILCAPNTVLTLAPQLPDAEFREPLAGLQPVVPVAKLTFAVVVGPKVPASVTTLQQLKAWYQENPSLAKLGLPGKNTASHFLAIEIQDRVELGAKFAMYQGSGDILPDLLSGSLPAALIFAGGPGGPFEGGKLRRLAVTSRDRWVALPDVPTITEQGVANAVAEEGFGLHVHPDTPAEIVQQIAATVRGFGADAVSSTELRRSGWLELPTQPSPAMFRDQLLRESQVWAKRIAASIGRG